MVVTSADASMLEARRPDEAAQIGEAHILHVATCDVCQQAPRIHPTTVAARSDMDGPNGGAAVSTPLGLRGRGAAE